MVKRVGVIGGGQLAWMMASAAEKLEIELVVQTPSATDPAVEVAADAVFAAVDDALATAQLAAQCDVITFENEFVNLDALALLESQGVDFCPRLSSLQPLLDKYHQRCYLRNLGIPVPDFSALDLATQSPVRAPLPLPCVLKARRHGYDGQGTVIVKTQAEWNALQPQLSDRPWLVEAFVPFERELAIMVARSRSGEIVTYPVVETQQDNQVCRRVFAPAAVAPAVVAEVEQIARTLVSDLHIVGIIGIELFLTPTGQVLVNEIAPRTHNSGHFSLDACETSQFEQQLRAVANRPLGQVDLRSRGAVMVNLLGYEYSDSDYCVKRQHLSQVPQARVHWYGKTESRPGRKLGHVTVLLDDPSWAPAIAQRIEAIWYP